MNALQIMRKARFETDSIRTGNTNSAMWAEEEVLDALNTAMDIAARVIRLSNSHILVKTMGSGDADVTIPEEIYDPSSLALADETRDYTLPPDYVSVVGIRPTTDGFDGIRFRPAALYHKHFMDQMTIPSADLSSVQEGESVFWYSFIGPRTIRYAPMPQDTIAIELFYYYRPPRLVNYSTGTVAITSGATALVGTSTVWTAQLSTPVEFISFDSTTVPDSSNISLTTRYPRVTTILTDTTATMTRNYSLTGTLSGDAYTLSMVPVLPQEHHAWLAQMTAAIMMRKVSVEMSQQAIGSLEKELEMAVKPEVTMAQVQESLPVEPFEIP